MSHRSVVLLLAGAALVCGAAVWILVTEKAAQVDPPRANERGRARQEKGRAGSHEQVARGESKEGASQELVRAERQRRRVELDRNREAIRERLARRAVEAAGRGHDDSSDAVLDGDYIRQTVSEGMLPVLHDCYDSELEDDPTLEGKVVLRFEILGDEEVGGVVDNVQLVEEQTTLRNEAVHECMQESMYALDFPAPSRGGTVTVTYPFLFRVE